MILQVRVAPVLQIATLISTFMVTNKIISVDLSSTRSAGSITPAVNKHFKIKTPKMDSYMNFIGKDQINDMNTISQGQLDNNATNFNTMQQNINESYKDSNTFNQEQLYFDTNIQTWNETQVLQPQPQNALTLNTTELEWERILDLCVENAKEKEQKRKNDELERKVKNKMDRILKRYEKQQRNRTDEGRQVAQREFTYGPISFNYPPPRAIDWTATRRNGVCEHTVRGTGSDNRVHYDNTTYNIMSHYLKNKYEKRMNKQGQKQGNGIKYKSNPLPVETHLDDRLEQNRLRNKEKANEFAKIEFETSTTDVDPEFEAEEWFEEQKEKPGFVEFLKEKTKMPKIKDIPHIKIYKQETRQEKVRKIP